MVLTEEQKKRIEKNRREAQARLRQRRQLREHRETSTDPQQDKSNSTTAEHASSAVGGGCGQTEVPDPNIPHEFQEGDSRLGSARQGSRVDPDEGSSATLALRSPSASLHIGVRGSGIGARGSRTGGASRQARQGGLKADASGGSPPGEEREGARVASVLICEGCSQSGVPMDQELLEGFNVPVCRVCKLSCAEFQCVTKKEAKESYLLPEGTIAVLKYIERDNPHHSSWTKMKLFLRRDVMQYSYRRWNDEAGLETERRRRDAIKYDRALARTKFTQHGAFVCAAACGDFLDVMNKNGRP